MSLRAHPGDGDHSLDDDQVQLPRAHRARHALHGQVRPHQAHLRGPPRARGAAGGVQEDRGHCDQRGHPAHVRAHLHAPPAARLRARIHHSPGAVQPEGPYDAGRACPADSDGELTGIRQKDKYGKS